MYELYLTSGAELLNSRSGRNEWRTHTRTIPSRLITLDVSISKVLKAVPLVFSDETTSQLAADTKKGIAATIKHKAFFIYTPPFRMHSAQKSPHWAGRGAGQLERPQSVENMATPFPCIGVSCATLC